MTIAQIRLPEPGDTRAVREVLYKTWLATYPNADAGITVRDVEERFKDYFTDESLRRSTERIEGHRADKNFFVAQVGEQVVGFCRTARHPDYNQLHAIYVLPEYQGRGIGAALWGEAKNNLEVDKDIVVEVASYNTRAIAFYEKIGFKQVGDIFLDERVKMKSGNIIPQIRMRLVATH